MKHLKNLLIFTGLPLLFITLLFLMSAGGSLSSTQGAEWYFEPNEEHLQPRVIDQIPLEGRSVLYSGNAEEKKVTLTFDAGYDNGYHQQ